MSILDAFWCEDEDMLLELQKRVTCGEHMPTEILFD